MRETLGALLLGFVVLGCANAQDPGDGLSDTSVDDKAPYWSAGSATNEGKSTHLWIVNHAVTILGKHQDLPKAAKAYARLMSPACKPNWQAGLKDADDKPGYNNWYTWRSHFYDPSTGTNYTGGTNPVAYKEALSRLATAKTKLAANDVKNGCYELGLALHYATDLTQPMHSANFAATDRPVNLHSHLEDRATVIQNGFVASDWTGSAPTASVNQVLLDIAWASHALWPATWDALANAYAVKCDDDMEDEWFDSTSCWEGDVGVDNAIGSALRASQSATAKFLYAADLP